MKELLDYIDIKITDRYQLRYAVLTLFQRKWASLDVCSKKKSIEKIHDRKLRISSLILAIIIFFLFFALFLEPGNFSLL